MFSQTYDLQKKTTKFQQAIEAEPFYNTSLQQVQLQSICFNDSIIDQKISIKILNKLIYNLNQGQELPQLEMDQLFFKVTKLLSQDCIYLRRIAYFTLKNEVQRSNQMSKLNAIRMITHLQNFLDQSIMERILRNNIGQSQLLSSAAMLVGLKILQNHPTVILRLTHELYERLNDKYQLNSFHAVLLLHESKKDNQIKLLNQMMKLDLSPIAKMQLIRFIRFQLQPTNENQLNPNALNQENMNYLLQTFNSSEPLLILEAIKSIVQIGYFSEDAFKLMINSISPFLESHACQVNKYAGLSIVKKIISKKRHLLSTFSWQFINLIENLCYDCSGTIKSLAIGILNMIYQENTSQQLAKMYIMKSNLQILEGIYEFILINPGMADQITEFINLTFDETNLDSVYMYLHILEQVMQSLPKDRHKAIKLLIKIGNIDDRYIQYEVIQILQRQLKGIDYEETEFDKIKDQLQFFEKEYLLNEVKISEKINSQGELSKINTQSY